MAWTDQCKVAFKTNADVLLWKQKKQTKKGIMKILAQLSEQSGIPIKTLWRWYDELEKEKEEHFANLKNLKNETNLKDDVTNENDIEKKEKESSELCVKCNINPKSKGRNDCSDCNYNTVRDNKLKNLKSVMTQVEKIKENIIKEGSAEKKWNYKIYKNEYEQFINILIEVVETWRELTK